MSCWFTQVFVHSHSMSPNPQTAVSLSFFRKHCPVTLWEALGQKLEVEAGWCTAFSPAVFSSFFKGASHCSHSFGYGTADPKTSAGNSAGHHRIWQPAAAHHRHLHQRCHLCKLAIMNFFFQDSYVQRFLKQFQKKLYISVSLRLAKTGCSTMPRLHSTVNWWHPIFATASPLMEHILSSAYILFI